MSKLNSYNDTKAEKNFTSRANARLILVAIGVPFAFGLLEWFLPAEFTSKKFLVVFAFLTAVFLIFFIGMITSFLNKEEQKLRYREKLARILLENRKNYAIFMIDSEGKIISWNKGTERLMGYTEKEILGKPLSILFTEEDKKNHILSDMLRHIKEEQQIEFEGWRVTKTGRLFWATITSTVIYENNKPIGFTKLYRDSTRQKETDEKLKRLVASLERSNKELERFAYIASHDLQEPLRMVASYTQLLEKKYKNKLDNEAKDYIHFAVDGAMRMQKLITDLLTYSRITTRAKPFLRTNLNELIEQALNNLSVLIKETNAQVTVDELPAVMADETQMIQLFQNLISNAIKFNTNSTPKIHISADQIGANWKFSVIDNGIGIPQEFHERIFQIFQRLHPQQSYQGTGVGLALCKKIVERHGGKIWVESSSLGEGAKFCFTMPA